MDISTDFRYPLFDMHCLVSEQAECSPPVQEIQQDVNHLTARSSNPSLYSMHIKNSTGYSPTKPVQCFYDSSKTLNIPEISDSSSHSDGIISEKSVKSGWKDLGLRQTPLKCTSVDVCGAMISDSGFSTETKEHSSSGSMQEISKRTAGATNSNESILSDDPLMAMLNMIEEKGRFMKEHLDGIANRNSCENYLPLHMGFSLPAVCRTRQSYEIQQLKQHSNYLAERITQLEADRNLSQMREKELRTKIDAFESDKKCLESQLKNLFNISLDNKNTNNNCVTNVCINSSCTETPIADTENIDIHESTDDLSIHLPNTVDYKAEIYPAEWHTNLVSQRLSPCLSCDKILNWNEDGIPIIKPKPNRKEISATLKENNMLNLKRRLLEYIHMYETLKAELEALCQNILIKSTNHEVVSRQLSCQVEDYKEQVADLRIQLEVKNIELEGTLARMRMLERSLHSIKNDRVSSPLLKNKQTNDSTFGLSTPQDTSITISNEITLTPSVGKSCNSNASYQSTSEENHRQISDISNSSAVLLPSASELSSSSSQKRACRLDQFHKKQSFHKSSAMITSKVQSKPWFWSGWWKL